MTDPTLVKLREVLLNEFNEAELASLCRDIGLNYEALPGTGAFGKTREIIEAARAQDKLRPLHNRLRELRPEAYAAAGLGPQAATMGDVAPTPITPVTSVATAPAVAASTVAVPPQAPDGAAAATAAATAAPPASREARRDSGVGPLPLLALGLVALLCAVVGLAVLLPRMNEVPATSTPVAQVPAGGPAAGATEAATPEAAATASGSVLVPAATEAPAVVVPPVEPVAVEGPAEEQATPGATAAVTATGATVGAQPTEAVVVATATPPVVTVKADDHPAVATVHNMNAQLPLFYTGQVSEQDITQFWTGEALRSVTGFGATRLLRAMRLTPEQRNTLEIGYQYQTAPKLAGETGNTAVVTSREEWRYANSLNSTQICEVRDYVYNLVKENERFRVRDFNSRLVRSGCQPQ